MSDNETSGSDWFVRLVARAVIYTTCISLMTTGIWLSSMGVVVQSGLLLILLGWYLHTDS